MNEIIKEERAENRLSKKDLYLGFLSGLLIGLLFLPVLKAARPTVYESFWFFIIPFFVITVPLGLWIAKMISRKIAVIWQIAKFGVIGILNTFVDLGVLAFLTFTFRSFFGIEPQDLILNGILTISFYSFYKSISFIAANINSFFWNKHWTFEHTSKKSREEFFQFFAVSVVGFLLNVFVASFVFKSVTPFAGMTSDQWGLVGALAGTAVGLVWNFIGYKFIVFKK